MFGHAVSQYSEDGKFITKYDTINDALKAGAALHRGAILNQINGKRKYCLWYSHLYRNDIVLRNGTRISNLK